MMAARTNEAIAPISITVPTMSVDISGTTTTGMNLGFDDNNVCAQLFRGGFGFFGGVSNNAARDGHPKLFQ